MGKRSRPIRQSQDLRFYLALAFLVWSLVPHFQLIFHAHGGADGHAHAALSAGEIELADQALQALPSAEPREFGGEPVAAPQPTAGGPIGGEAWTTGPGLLVHAHFHQDQNTVSALLVRLASAVPPIPETSNDLLYRAPAPAAPADRPARGPPVAFLA